MKSISHWPKQLGGRIPKQSPSSAASFSPRRSPSNLPLRSFSSIRPQTTRLLSISSHISRHFSSSTPRSFATEVDAEEPFDINTVERVSDECDVCIVGGGPSGLSAAIRLKQLAEKEGREIRVVLLEKGGEIGSHIVSGAVIETRALDELIPNWKELGAPLNQIATSDHMRWLTPTMSFPIPHPPQMSNKGNYIISLSKLTRWLSEQAEELGVEIYPGFAAAQVLYTEDGKAVKGVVTNEIGLDKNYKPKDGFEPGMEFHAKVTLFAEGAHGSLSKKVISKFGLREGKDVQTYGLGVKEVWKVKPENHKPGTIQHTLGWPLDNATYGGTWLYHMEDEMVSLGIVVGLDYPNPYLSPFKELQRVKHHPLFAKVLEGGECIAYAARALNEGGFQSIPKLTFPGGGLIGCSAGFLNVPKIKGTHTAMKTGMLAADATFSALSTLPEDVEAESLPPVDISSYQTLFDESWVAKELYEVRNVRPSFHNPIGNWGGIAYSGIDTMLLKGRTPWTFHHPKEDFASTKPASECNPITYPVPDNVLSFDILTSVSRTGTNHAENQPVHLFIKPEDRASHVKVNVEKYAGLLGRVCPAAVYEYVEAEGAEADANGMKLVINSQNCIHCKTCSIKVPTQDIEWRVPEGSGGPKYSIT